MIELLHFVVFVVVDVAGGVVHICCLAFGLDMGLVLVAC